MPEILSKQLFIDATWQLTNLGIREQIACLHMVIDIAHNIMLLQASDISFPMNKWHEHYHVCSVALYFKIFLLWYRQYLLDY
jgi:hypothetical protein